METPSVTAAVIFPLAAGVKIETPVPSHRKGVGCGPSEFPAHEPYSGDVQLYQKEISPPLPNFYPSEIFSFPFPLPPHPHPITLK